jgi:hypothetical protein
MPRFARIVEKPPKARRGQTRAEATPIAIRSEIELSPAFEDRIREELGSHIGYAATQIERGTVRFEDVNGPKGGVDTICRIKLVISGRPSLIVEYLGADPRSSFTRALHKLALALERMREKHGLTAKPARRHGASPAKKRTAARARPRAR